MTEEQVTLIKWLTDDSLVVAGSEKSLALVSVHGAKLTVEWSRTYAEDIANPFFDQVLQYDDKEIWAMGRPVLRVDRKDGHVIGTIAFGENPGNVSLAHGKIYVEQRNTLAVDVWDWDPRTQKPTRTAKIAQTEPVAPRIFPLDQKTVAMGRDGRIYVLKDNQLEPMPIETREMWIAKPDRGWSTPEELKEVGQLSRQVDRQTSDRILREANQHAEWTPRQKAQWVRDELRKAIAKNEEKTK